jgi:hypothetical protein
MLFPKSMAVNATAATSSAMVPVELKERHRPTLNAFQANSIKSHWIVRPIGVCYLERPKPRCPFRQSPQHQNGPLGRRRHRRGHKRLRLAQTRNRRRNQIHRMDYRPHLSHPDSSPSATTSPPRNHPPLLIRPPWSFFVGFKWAARAVRS